MRPNYDERAEADVTVATAAIPPRFANVLPLCITSVLAQTVLPRSHAVVLDVCCEGEAITRNRAANAADTEWLAFLDDDDVLMPHHIETLMTAAHDSDADIIYPWFTVDGGEDPFPEAFGREFSPEDLRTRTYIPVTLMVKTELFHEVGGFPEPDSLEWKQFGLDPGKGMGPDWGFLLKCLDREAKFLHVPERTWVWNHHHHNTSGRPWSDVY
jgi:hypothetical protein